MPTIQYPLSFQINLYDPNKWSMLTSKGWEYGAMPHGKGNTGLLKEPVPSAHSH